MVVAQWVALVTPDGRMVFQKFEHLLWLARHHEIDGAALQMERAAGTSDTGVTLGIAMRGGDADLAECLSEVIDDADENVGAAIVADVGLVADFLAQFLAAKLTWIDDSGFSGWGWLDVEARRHQYGEASLHT